MHTCILCTIVRGPRTCYNSFGAINLASKNRWTRDLVRLAAHIGVTAVVIDVDLNTRVVALVGSREADEVSAGVGAGASDTDSVLC